MGCTLVKMHPTRYIYQQEDAYLCGDDLTCDTHITARDEGLGEVDSKNTEVQEAHEDLQNPYYQCHDQHCLQLHLGTKKGYMLF